MTRKDDTGLGHQAEQSIEPAIVDLGQHKRVLFGGLTEMTVKYEAQEALSARLRQADQQAAHERRLDIIRLAIAGIMLFGFLGLGIYLLAFRPNATEDQQVLALVGSLISGGGVYTFGSKAKKPS